MSDRRYETNIEGILDHTADSARSSQHALNRIAVARAAIAKATGES